MLRFRDGNQEAFSLLVGRYHARLLNFLMRYTNSREDAEDLVQETFIKVHRAAHNYRDIARFSTWLYTIALNLVRSSFRKANRIHQMPILAGSSEDGEWVMEVEDLDLLPDQSMQQDWNIEQMIRALEGLSDEFRTAIVLRDFLNMSYESIATRTQVSVGTVKSRINRARTVMRTLLDHPDSIRS